MSSPLLVRCGGLTRSLYRAQYVRMKRAASYKVRQT